MVRRYQRCQMVVGSIGSAPQPIRAIGGLGSRASVSEARSSPGDCVMTSASEHALIDAIYDAVVHPDSWGVVCDRIAALAGATGTLLIPGRAEARAYGIPHSQSVGELFESYMRD